jgi:hypothetical protein
VNLFNLLNFFHNIDLFFGNPSPITVRRVYSRRTGLM